PYNTTEQRGQAYERECSSSLRELQFKKGQPNSYALISGSSGLTESHEEAIRQSI
ncbi:unnamed protein product, partial [marine sediment metagenome]